MQTLVVFSGYSFSLVLSVVWGEKSSSSSGCEKQAQLLLSETVMNIKTVTTLETSEEDVDKTTLETSVGGVDKTTLETSEEDVIKTTLETSEEDVDKTRLKASEEDVDKTTLETSE
jgi:hypothetical protein